MDLKRYYITSAIAILLVLLTWHFFGNYEIFHDKSTRTEYLKETKYIHLDCGKILLCDRTEDSQMGIDYYVTYESEIEEKPVTLSVTTSAYVEALSIKESGGEICFNYKDPQYESHSFIYGFLWVCTFVSFVIFICQFVLILISIVKYEGK